MALWSRGSCYFVTFVGQGHPEDILSVIEQGREVEPVCTVQPV